MDQLTAGLADFGGGPLIGESSAEDVCALVAEQARERGLPVIRAHCEGDCVVLELARPRGSG